MNCGKVSNWVHWLYAVRTGTSTSMDCSIVLIPSRYPCRDFATRVRIKFTRRPDQKCDPCSDRGECVPRHAGKGVGMYIGIGTVVLILLIILLIFLFRGRSTV